MLREGRAWLHPSRPIRHRTIGRRAQRVKLATELQRTQRGGTLYVLDEPTTGLHPADVAKLLKQLDGLVNAGATVLLVEHDMSVAAASDWIIDVGPAPARRVVASSSPEHRRRLRQALPAGQQNISQRHSESCFETEPPGLGTVNRNVLDLARLLSTSILRAGHARLSKAAFPETEAAYARVDLGDEAAPGSWRDQLQRIGGGFRVNARSSRVRQRHRQGPLR